MKDINIANNHFLINQITPECFLLTKTSQKTSLSQIADLLSNSGLVDDICATDSEIMIFGKDIDWTKVSLLALDESPVSRKINIPVCFEEYLDWDGISSKLKIKRDNIIDQLLKTSFALSFKGFMLGFVYLNGLPNDLQIPRKSNPQKVEKGAVGIGGKYLGIYPQESPGGWNIIGNCPLHFFELEKEKPFLLEVNDQIHLESISAVTHRAIKKQKLNILSYNGYTD